MSTIIEPIKCDFVVISLLEKVKSKIPGNNPKPVSELQTYNQTNWEQLVEHEPNAITDSGNKYLFAIPYTPKTNAVEMWFNQVKHILKLNIYIHSFQFFPENLINTLTKTV